MDFVKMQGLGNDFVLLAGPRSVAKDEVVAWCDRHLGVGADGVLVATPLDAGRVRMEYWNADGGAAEMCGNGLRCVARYAVDEAWVSGLEFVVETGAGDRSVTVRSDGTVRAQVGRPVDPAVAPFVMAGYEVHPVSLGNPHAVIFVDDVLAVPVDAVGPLVETDPRFPDRTNVEFVSVEERDRASVRVWERGVGETLASGTGAAAGVVVANRLGRVSTRVTVDLLGGPLLIEVRLDGVWMEGPAEYVFRGTL